jgi:hypothetical protein
MDPATLAASAVSLMAGYLSRNKDKLADKAGDAVVGGLERLYHWVADRFRRQAPTASALDGLEQTPDDARKQGAVEFALAQLIDQDAEFARQLAELVTTVEQAGGGSVHISDSGAVSFGEQRISGKYVAGRDLRIDSPQDDR